jgi:exonuclease-1
MGIEGLLPLLKPIQRQVHIKDYSGKAVAIDGHCILHRGAYGAATALAEGVDTDTYVYNLSIVSLHLKSHL